MEYNIQDFLTVIQLKNQLINLSFEQLLELNKTEDQHVQYVSSINTLLQKEEAFVFMDSDILHKIENLIYKQRFLLDSMQVDSLMQINRTILKLNELKFKTAGYINSLKNSYLFYQENCRRIEFEENDDLLISMAYDFEVYRSLQNGQLNDLEDIFFFGSTNYFLESIPELYQNSSFYDQTLQKLVQDSKKRGFWNKCGRGCAKKTLDNFQKKLGKG